LAVQVVEQTKILQLEPEVSRNKAIQAAIQHKTVQAAVVVLGQLAATVRQTSQAMAVPA
jgi:hypothetical protein